MIKSYQMFSHKFKDFYMKNKVEYESIEVAMADFEKQIPKGQYTDRRLSQFKDFIIFESKGLTQAKIYCIIESLMASDRAYQIVDNPDLRQELVEEALRLWDENYEAIILSTRYNLYEKMTHIQKMIDRERLKWRDEEKRGWYSWFERSFLRLENYLASLYIRNGLYEEAVEVLKDSIEYDTDHRTYAASYLMTAYTYLGEFDQVRKIFKETSNAENRVSLVIPMLMVSILDQDEKEALKYFSWLMENHPTCMDRLIGMEKFSAHRILAMGEETVRGRISSLVTPEEVNDFRFFNTFANFVALLITSSMINNYFHVTYQSIIELRKEERAPSKASPEEDNILRFPLIPPKKVKKKDENIYHGVPETERRILHLNGFTSHICFKNITTDQILSLPGISSETVDRLTLNGVQFKEV